MDRYENRIERFRAVLSAAEGVLIGGGSGLSAAAGLTYSGPRFTENFADFIEKYGVEDMYSASFYSFRTPEELWAHWARHIHVNRFAQAATPLYRDLLAIVKAKPHFVITTNVESQFEKAGFLPERIFEVQGNYAYFQCAAACHDKRYYNESRIKEMLASTVDCKVPSSLVPACPVCGGPMDVNLRHNEYFVQDASWHESSARYGGFIEKMARKPLVCLELGVGFNTPGIIRYPFEKLVYRNDKATLVRVNREDSRGFPENELRTIAFDEDMRTVIQDAARSWS
jgi:NAD-dependent SIR2 family protein deacetylase